MRTYLGIEFGSTRIKAVLIDEKAEVLAVGGHTWENELSDGIWTYSEEAVWSGLADAYSDLAAAYRKAYGHELTEVDALGISGMMHGYIALDDTGELLAPFRTWRNTNTEAAATELSAVFGCKIPLRWTIAQLYESILEDMPHVRKIDRLTTLAGYVHGKLTGEHVLGMNEASGVFPLDSKTGGYRADLVEIFEGLAAKHGYPVSLAKLLPRVLPAGKCAGYLTEAGVRLLGPDCKLSAGIPLCPPEGDAGTGMTATGSVRPRTGNVSAGTSIFTMVVLDKENARLASMFDTVTTPDGAPVVMVQCNNFTSDINAYASLFAEFAAALGVEVSMGKVFDTLFEVSRKGDTAGLMNYNFLSGEPTVGLKEGRPLFFRAPDAELSLSGFMKTQIYSALAAFAIGVEGLKEEKVAIDRMFGHGGFFKTPEVAGVAMSAAIGAPIVTAETAGEGGAWGIAVLASYLDAEGSLPDYLDGIFGHSASATHTATDAERAEFLDFLARFRAALPVERTATEI